MKKQSQACYSRWVQATLAGSILLASLGVSIATVALPSLAQAFSAQMQTLQWIVLAYLLSVTATIVQAGRLGDLYGSRRVLIAGLSLFTLASVACALAPTLDYLIAARAVQGLAAAILMSIPMAMAKELLAKERLGRVMGLLGTMSAIGTALGPSLGGLVIGTFGWPAAFAVLAVCGLILLAFAITHLPGSVTPKLTPARMDWAGSLCLSISLLSFALAATGSKTGLGIPPWMLLVLSAMTGGIFIQVERIATYPLIPVSVLYKRNVATALSMNVLVGTIMMATLVVGPFFLSLGLGLSAAHTGLVMATGPLAAALSGVPAGRLTDRFGTSKTLLAGLILSTIGLIAFSTLPHFIHATGYVMALLLITPGFQLFMAANNTKVMLAASQEEKGLLSGLLGLSRNLGFMAGASLIPLLFASWLPARTLIDSTPQAISHAFSLTFLLTAALCALAMILAVWGYRRPGLKLLAKE